MTRRGQAGVQEARVSMGAKPLDHYEYAEEIAGLLSSHNQAARIAAVKLLQAADADSVHALLSIAKDGARRAAIRRALYRAACGICILLLAGTALTLVFDALVAAPPMQLSFVFFLGIAAMEAPAENEVASALLHLDDPRAAGPIAESLDSPDTRWVAEEVLIRLLPRMRPADGLLLNEAQRASLYRNLRRGNTRYVLASLQALQQIGDEGAISHVKRLAESRGRGTAAREIREAAQFTLPFVEGQVAQARNRRTLVRAAPEPTERLPRPADEPTDRLPRISSEPSDKLLKPLRWSRIPPETLVRPHPDEPSDRM